MSMKPSRQPSSWPAPCRSARRVLMLSAGVSLLCLLIVGGHLTARQVHPGNDPSRVWMRVFTLSSPALWPAGTPERHPESRHPGVDPRFTAGLEGTP